MNESAGEISSERMGDLLAVARKAKERGFSKRDRRERVIAEIGHPSLDLEEADVRERAIHKYWEVKPGSSETPVILVAPHVQKAGRGEIASLLHDKFPDLSSPALLELINQWLEAPGDEKPHKVLSKDDPNYEIFQAIARMRNKGESYTDVLAESVADASQSAVMIAKKSRMWADPNRRSFFDKPRGAGKGKAFIQTKEHPTSVRASWYWGARDVVEKTVGLDTEGKAEKPFLQIAVHGMADRKSEAGQSSYDIVIGAGSPKKGEEGKLADERVLNWFARSLTQKLAEKEAVIKADQTETENLRVAIDRMGVKQVDVFEADKEGQVEKSEIERVGAGLSGAGLGLEYFRQGADFTVEDVGGEEKRLSFPGFGNCFQTIQLEISKNVRFNPLLRKALAQFLGEIALEFKEKFPSSDTLIE